MRILVKVTPKWPIIIRQMKGKWVSEWYICSIVIERALRLPLHLNHMQAIAPTGLMKACRDVFSESTHFVCVKHLRDNIVVCMRNKCGVQQSVRNRLVAKMFDDGGLINANDSVAFSRAADALTDECNTASGQHFRRHVEPALRTFVFEPKTTSVGQSAVEQQRRRVSQPPAEDDYWLASAAFARACRPAVQGSIVTDDRPSPCLVQPRQLHARGAVPSFPSATHSLAGEDAGGEGGTVW